MNAGKPNPDSDIVLRAIPPGHDQAERLRTVEAVAAKLREIGWECDVLVFDTEDGDDKTDQTT